MVLIMLVVLLVLLPPILSIIALVRVSALRRELEALRSQVRSFRTAPKPVNPVAETPVAAAVAAAAPVLRPADSVPAAALPRVVVSPTPVATPAVKAPEISPTDEPREKSADHGLEQLMGGRAAAFAGIGILVAGIALLVGYAIQHSWVGPGIRTLVGLLAGGVLVGAGHYFEQKKETYRLLARVLTGGGSALFYFTVYAAYGFYHLIGGWAAGAGLLGSALAVFGLAVAYQSQAVALLGVLGAFVTPLLIGGEKSSALFMLVYGAVVNVPVILLGIRRKWQALYNVSFVFSIIYYLLALDARYSPGWEAGIGFALLYFAEFAALGLIKLRAEQQVTGRVMDFIRLPVASVLVAAAVCGWLSDANLNDWMGAALLALALVHAALAYLAFRVLTRFTGEILAFLGGGLFCAVLALPAQLDGEWVSLGWALEGVALAWFSRRVRSRVLQSGAFLVGMIGLLKALGFDGSLYDRTPDLFLNARFITGMISAALLGVQGVIAGRSPDTEKGSPWQDVLWWVAAIGMLLVFFADTFWILGAEDAFCLLSTSLALLAMGAGLVLLAPAGSSVTLLGMLLLLLVPVKLLAWDAGIGFHMSAGFRPFGSAILWVQLGVLCLLIPLIQSCAARRTVLPAYGSPLRFHRALNLLSICAAIGLVTLEINRSRSAWGDPAITLFWALTALGLILYGMIRWRAAHRYLGLALFAVTTFKVLVVDASELKGLERIAAFIGTGILLLVLSFAYQKAAAYFQRQGEKSCA